MTSSRVESHQTRVRDENGLYYDTTVYEAVLRYTYTVGGEVKEGTRLSRQGGPNTKEGAQRCVDAYPAQKAVEVLCDPSDPGTAYLEVHRSVGAVILLAFGGLWLSLAALFVVLQLTT